MTSINYSKWDKLELSDDEDFECHPNVDKASMIRWKQAKIHQDRRDKKDLILILEYESKLLDRISTSLSNVTTQEHYSNFVQFSDKEFVDYDQKIVEIRSKERSPRWGPVEPIPSVDKRLKIAFYIKDHPKFEPNTLSEIENLIKSRKQEIKDELKSEEELAKKKLTSDNIVEGFNRTVVAKKETKEKVIETIHEPLQRTPILNEEEGPIITNPLLDHFTYLNMESSQPFLLKNMDLITTESSDLVLAQAFQWCQIGNLVRCKECIRQSFILSYSKLLTPNLFFSKIHLPATIATFEKDIQETFDRINSRVKVLQEEEMKKLNEEKEVGEMRVKAATQPDGSFALPSGIEPGDEERALVFSQLTKELQRGLLLQDVDVINEALGALEPSVANQMMNDAARVGLVQMEQEEE